MPIRMVDGEGVWGSEKLSRADKLVRPEYANWIPLAEANGVFEIDPKKIWSRLYSYNRSEVPIDFVAFVIGEFVRVGLLKTWTQDGRLYGFWTGIDKKGRLPSLYHRGKFKNLPPNPPEDLLNQVVSSSSVDDVQMIESDGGDCIPNQTIPLPIPNQNQTASEEFEMASSRKKLQEIVKYDVPEHLAKKFRDKYWDGDKYEALREYIQNHPDSQYPLQEFLGAKPEVSATKSYVQSGIIQREDVKKLGVKIFTITDIQMSQKQIAGAASLLDVYTEEEILFAFNWTYSKCPDDFSRNQSVNRFFAGGSGEIAILSLREQKAKQEHLARLADAPASPPELAPIKSEPEDIGDDIDF